MRPTIISQQLPRRGAAAVEAAFMLPLLVFLVLGMCEAGWYVNCAQVVHDAARQGVRVAVSKENSNAEVEASVYASLSNSLDIDADAVTVRISKLGSTGDEDYQVLNLSENEQGETIRVFVTVDYKQIGLLTNLLGLREGFLQSYAVMRRQK